MDNFADGPPSSRVGVLRRNVRAKKVKATKRTLARLVHEDGPLALVFFSGETKARWCVELAGMGKPCVQLNEFLDGILAEHLASNVSDHSVMGIGVLRGWKYMRELDGNHATLSLQRAAHFCRRRSAKLAFVGHPVLASAMFQTPKPMAADWRGLPPRTLGAQIRKMAELEAWGAVVTGAQGSSPRHVISVATLIEKWEKTYGYMERTLSWSTAPKLATALALGVIPMDITCLVRKKHCQLATSTCIAP